jgi:hypothetical protein
VHSERAGVIRFMFHERFHQSAGFRSIGVDRDGQT